MTIAQSFYTFLAANSPVDSIVDGRIFPQVIPQSELGRPAITYEQDAGEDWELLSGRSDSQVAQFRVSCWSTSYLTTRTMAQTVENELVGYRGTFGAHTADMIRKVNDFDGGYEVDTQLYRAIVEFSVAYY